MKSKTISLAFLLVFAFSTSALADGETGLGNRTQNPPPSTATQSNSSSANLLTQLIDAIKSIIP